MKPRPAVVIGVSPVSDGDVVIGLAGSGPPRDERAFVEGLQGQQSDSVTVVRQSEPNAVGDTAPEKSNVTIPIISIFSDGIVT